MRIFELARAEPFDPEEEGVATGCANLVNLVHKLDGLARPRLRQKRDHAGSVTQPIPVTWLFAVGQDLGPIIDRISTVRSLETTIKLYEIPWRKPHWVYLFRKINGTLNHAKLQSLNDISANSRSRKPLFNRNWSR